MKVEIPTSLKNEVQIGTEWRKDTPKEDVFKVDLRFFLKFKTAVVEEK